MSSDIHSKAALSGHVSVNSSITGELKSKTVLGNIILGDAYSKAALSGYVSAIGSITGELKSKTVLGNIILGNTIKPFFPYYDGEYEATPTLEEQVYLTNQRSMNGDFVVHKIPYQEILNSSGGYTAIIG